MMTFIVVCAIYAAAAFFTMGVFLDDLFDEPLGLAVFGLFWPITILISAGVIIRNRLDA